MLNLKQNIAISSAMLLVLLTGCAETEEAVLMDPSVNVTVTGAYAGSRFTYEYGTDLDDAYMELKSELDNLAGDLPEECDPPRIMEININSDATIAVAAKSTDGADILDYINDTVVPKLEGI